MRTRAVCMRSAPRSPTYTETPCEPLAMKRHRFAFLSSTSSQRATTPRLIQAFRADAVAMCDRVILDTGAYDDAAETLQMIAREFDVHGASLSLNDIAWQRTRPWREAVAIAFDGPDVRPWLHRVVGV